MNCTKCNDLGWLCEEHPEQMQGHNLSATKSLCTGAGMPCTCDAFPHKKKPREFWIGIDENDFARWMSEHENFQFVDKNYDCKKVFHVREVIEISDEEIAQIADEKINNFTTSSSVRFRELELFERGFRSALAKMRGE